MNNTFFEYGNIITNSVTSSSSIALRRFKAFFGVSPSICAKVWSMIMNNLPSDFSYKHLLWALLFLKCYHTENVNHSLARCDEKTFREKTLFIIAKLAVIPVVEWHDRKRSANPGQTCFISVDGTDCKINEPSPFSSKWFSHKFKSAGLRYEIGLCINTGEIVWVNGSYPCGEWPDLRIARDLLVSFLEPQEKVLADRGYRDNRYFLLPNPENSIEHKRIMSRHETVNKRIKQFNVLSERFRHDIDYHKTCFNAVVNLTQLVIKFEEPLFSVN